jgi:hypothetical protein
MKKYIIRSLMLTLLFVDVIIGGFSVFSVYSVKRQAGMIFVPVSVLWTAYFSLLLLMMVLHRKDHMQKAMKNINVLAIAGVFLMFLSLMWTLVSTHSLHIPKLYIFFSLVSIIYFCARHEGRGLVDFFILTLSYTTELFRLKLRSSFAKYLVFEFFVFVLLVYIIHRSAA